MIRVARALATSALLPFLLVVGTDGRADQTEAAQGASLIEAVKAAPKRGLLFEASKDGNTAVIFGTVHAGKREYYPLNWDVVSAISSAKAVAFEIDLADPRNPEVLRELSQYSPAG